MKRSLVVHKANSFKEADEWDVKQQLAMTPQERFDAVKVLRERVYPKDAKDVRACHRTR